MSDALLRRVLKASLDDLQAKGLYKRERLIESPQGTAIRGNGRDVINVCANHHLGPANHPDLLPTDRVFSMDGDLAPLVGICELAERHAAAVMIDESHGTGHLGPTGRGAAEQLGVLDRIDIITSTLGKTLGGAVGGFTTGSQEIVDYLRQRSRPYLFSNSLTPSIAAAAKKAFELVAGTNELRDRLRANTERLRAAL